LRREKSAGLFPRGFYAGLPAVVAYHASDWVGFVIDAVIDEIFDEEETYTSTQLFLKHAAQVV
jgi:hypothetical protein